MTNKDKTGGERQSRLRGARKKWLKEHGYKSVEGLVGALMRGEVVLSINRAPCVLPCSHPLAEAYQGEDGGIYCRISESA